MGGYVIHGPGDLADPPRETLIEFLAGLNDAPWVRDAVCAQVDTEIWFPTKRTGEDAEEESAEQFIRQAKDICSRCPVKAECLQYALDNDEAHGIWGGTVPKERRKMKTGANLPPRPCERDGCTEMIPGWERGTKRYHDKECGRLANEDRAVARIDHDAVIAAYTDGGISIARLASRHKVTYTVIQRVLDDHGVRRTHGGWRGGRVQPTQNTQESA